MCISDLFEDDHNETREDNKVLGSNINTTLGERPAYYLVEENKEGWETKNMMVGTIIDDDKILEIEYVAMPIVNQIVSSFSSPEESSGEENEDGNEEEETSESE